MVQDMKQPQSTAKSSGAVWDESFGLTLTRLEFRFQGNYSLREAALAQVARHARS